MKILTTICTTTEIENLPLKNSALSRGFITQVPLKIKSRGGGEGEKGVPKSSDNKWHRVDGGTCK